MGRKGSDKVVGIGSVFSVGQRVNYSKIVMCDYSGRLVRELFRGEFLSPSGGWECCYKCIDGEGPCLYFRKLGWFIRFLSPVVFKGTEFRCGYAFRSMYSDARKLVFVDGAGFCMYNTIARRVRVVPVVREVAYLMTFYEVVIGFYANEGCGWVKVKGPRGVRCFFKKGWHLVVGYDGAFGYFHCGGQKMTLVDMAMAAEVLKFSPVDWGAAGLRVGVEC